MAKKKKRSKRASTDCKSCPTHGTLPPNPQEEQPTEAPKVTASTKVLNTVELLELVLLELPVRDLLLVQRVCCTWHSTIENSRLLQQALFFKPIGRPFYLGDACKPAYSAEGSA